MTTRPERGVSVRVKIPGANGVAGYLITKAKGCYRVQGNWWVSLDGTYPRPLKDVEIIPVHDDGAAPQAAPQASPYPGWSGTPWQRLVEEMKR